MVAEMTAPEFDEEDNEPIVHVEPASYRASAGGPDGPPAIP
jgi:hypothetical protein